MMKEAEIHQAIVQWLDVVRPPGLVVHHSPNESWKSNVAYRMKQKRLSVLPGFPDLLLLCPMEHWKETFHWAPVLLEIKTAKGVVSANQRRCIMHLVGANCHVHIVRSIDETHAVLGHYMELRHVGRA
tara:strand:+ start:3325 stop:3708 length:384 start_codon:yes stop_codon:yes gene_type:complete